MSYPKMANLVVSLLKQTNDGRLHWGQTEKPDVFQAAFPRYSVRMYSRQANQIELDYILQIINDVGDIVEEVADPELREVLDGSYRVMKDLYEAARRSAMGVEQALDDILGYLDDPFL